jgi:hypothetical protein
MTQVMTKKFKDEYIKPLILEAVNKVEDFKKNKQEYCGLDITDSIV